MKSDFRILALALAAAGIVFGCSPDLRPLQTLWSATRRAFEKFLSLPSVLVLPVTRKTGAFYAQVYGFCRTAGQPIPTNDIWIAALSLESASPVLTDDRHLRSLPLVRTFSWKQ